jgi:hypothetical protein
MQDLFFFIYFGINAFTAGYFLSYYHEHPNYSKIYKFVLYAAAIFILLWGCLILFGYFLYNTFVYIREFFQICFFFNFYFTKKYTNLSEEKLGGMNKVIIEFNNTNTMRDKIIRYCMSLVNKRNGYIHNES